MIWSANAISVELRRLTVSSLQPDLPKLWPRAYVFFESTAKYVYECLICNYEHTIA